jgi:2,4-dienoyl-CoA reductase-like NADH-dependent reductase (Old Yellow Enzyme family)
LEPPEAQVGLILAEGMVVDRPAAKNDPQVPFFHGESALAGLQRVIDQVHSAGGKMGPQIWHVGTVAKPQTTWMPTGPVEGPSGLLAPEMPRGVAMTDEAIADTIAAFGRAAAAAKRLPYWNCRPQDAM